MGGRRATLAHGEQLLLSPADHQIDKMKMEYALAQAVG